MTPAHNVIPLQPRMQFPLPNIQGSAHFFHVGFEFVQMMHAVVADSERADLAGFLCLDQSFPRAFAGFRSPVGRVD